MISENLIENEERICTLLDPKTEQLIKKYLPENSHISTISDFFTAFSDPARLKIISALSISKMCVGDLSLLLGVNQTTLSHQLRFLRGAKIVECEKQGKVVFYYIERPLLMDFMYIAVKLAS